MIGDKKKKAYNEALRVIEQIGLDVGFVFNNKYCSICSMKDFYVLGYDGISTEAKTMDEVKTTKCFNGKSLNEIYKEVEFEW